MIPLCSIIIPTYNREKTILQSVESVLSQTFSDTEIIIVDDGSTDNTKSIIEQINDSRILYVRQTNAGAPSARNHGISLARGKYISFQDSDDNWFPYKLEHQINQLELTGTDLNICYMRSVDTNGSVSYVPEKRQIKEGLSFETLLSANYISTQMIVGKKYIFSENHFDVTLPRFQDWDLALRLLSKYSMSITPEVLVQQNLSSDSISKDPIKASIAYSIIEKKYHSYLLSNNAAYSKFLYFKANALNDLYKKKDLRDIYSLSLQHHFMIKAFVKFLLTYIDTP